MVQALAEGISLQLPAAAAEDDEGGVHCPQQDRNLYRVTLRSEPLTPAFFLCSRKIESRSLRLPRFCNVTNVLSYMHQMGSRDMANCWVGKRNDMTPTKLTSAPDGFEYYRICDEFGNCRVVRGADAAQHLVQDVPGLTATKTRLFSAG